MAGAEAVRSLFIGGRSSRSASEALDTKDEEERPPRNQKRSFVVSQRNMANAMNALERREDHRLRHLVECALQKEQSHRTRRTEIRDGK